ncbi:MAG: cation-translocating P-type ATPase [Candidatus Helarchaeota archaeon]
MAYYSKTLDEIFSELRTNPEIGLKLDEIPARLEKWGLNELPKIKRSIWRIYLAPVFNLLIIMLIIIAIPIAILGGIVDTVITFSVVIANAVAAIIQQYRAQKTLKSLMKLTALKATVIRNGIPTEIETTELVPGDIVELKQGDKVPADLRLISTVNLEVNEAPLTGESVAVQKQEETLQENNLPIQKQRNMAFQGTFVTSGKARAVVVYTGGRTEIGKISTELNESGVTEIPLTKKMNNFAKKLAIGVIIFITVALIYKISLFSFSGSTEPINQQIIDSIGAGKNLVPINLPLLTTLVLVTGVYNLAQQGVIIRNLTAIEALGRVSVICSDKTGTITKNEMTVKFIWYDDKNLLVPTVAYSETTPIYYEQNEYNTTADPYFELFIHSQVVNNNAEVTIDLKKVAVKGQKEKPVRQIIGAPTEGALLTLAENIGYNIIKIRNQYTILKEFPFDSSVKRMSTVVQRADGKNYAFVKGASEIIIDRCSKIILNGSESPLSEDFRQKILEDIDAAAKAGFRTLSIAYKSLTAQSNPDYERDDIEQNLTFLGFVSILDPPREGVKEAVDSCKQAQVNVVMVTGDHPVTAQSIAMQVGIFDPGEKVVEGNQIETLSDEEFLKTAVFARVSPKDKVKIVKRYQEEENRLVAMTGDGVNDSIALKQAHTGIAMGITGSDVAKEAADMVISDDNFTSIERGLRVGRGIFHRIRVIIFFFISLNLMEAFIFLAFQFYPDPHFSMFTFFQHTYLYITVHTFPSLALIIDKFPKDIMKEPPRDSEEIFTIPFVKLMAVQCLFMGIGITLAYLIPLWGLAPIDTINQMGYTATGLEVPLLGQLQVKARTMCMTVIFLAETSIVWSMRRPNSSIKDSLLKEFNIWLMIMIGFTLFLHFGAMYFGSEVNPVLTDFLGQEYYLGWMILNGWDWLWVIGLSSIGIIAVELYKWNARRHHHYF